MLPETISVDADYLRPYTDEFTGAVDHELIPSLRLSAVYTHRVERNPQATSNPANPYDTFPTTRVDPGRDGVAGTADDSRVPVLQPHLDGGEPDVLHQRPELPPDLQRHRDHRDVLPVYEIGLAGNFSSLSGVPITRQLTVAQTVGGNSSVNVEPLGSYRLDRRTIADLRVFETATFGTRALELSVDFNNLSNVNTVWDARTLGGTINLRQNGEPAGAINTLPQFGSPAQVYGPRNIRFNVALRF